MKVYSITFGTILNGLKHRWKIILASTLIFALLGAGCGYLFRGRGMAGAGGSAQPLPAVDLGALPYSQDYYTTCLNALYGGLDGLSRYMSVFSASTSPDAERQAALDAVRVDAAEFQSAALQPLQSALNEAGAVIVPEEFLDGMADRCARELASLRIDLLAAEAATETIRQMDAPDYAGDFSGSYGNLLALASQYPTMLRTQAVTEKYLDGLTNHMPEIRAESRRVERELDEAAETLAALMDRFLILADEAAKEEALVFTPKVEDGTATDVLVTHAHRASSAQESFAVIVLFCVLAGLCLGAFLAVCGEAKEEKLQAASRPEKA